MVADAGDGLIAAVVKDAESLFFRQVFHVFALTVGGNGNTVGNEVRVVQRIGNKNIRLVVSEPYCRRAAGMILRRSSFLSSTVSARRVLQKTVCAGMVTVWISKSFSLFTRSFSFQYLNSTHHAAFPTGQSAASDRWFRDSRRKYHPEKDRNSA